MGLKREEVISETSFTLYYLPFCFCGEGRTEVQWTQLPQIAAQRRPVIFTTGSKTKIVCQKSHPCGWGGGVSAIHNQCLASDVCLKGWNSLNCTLIFIKNLLLPCNRIKSLNLHSSVLIIYDILLTFPDILIRSNLPGLDWGIRWYSKSSTLLSLKSDTAESEKKL